MTRRRKFLQQAGLVSTSPFVPGFVANTLGSDTRIDDTEGRILVIIQLDGGNDGLNTIVPFAQEEYRKRRPDLALPTRQVLKINDDIGFHPAMTGAANLLEKDQLAVVQSVGYPNPNRSHFRSMAIWQTASTADDLPQLGWAGRALDARTTGGTDSMFVGTEDLPLSLIGRRSVAAALPPGETLQLKSKLNPNTAITNAGDEGDLQSFVRRNVLQAYRTVEQLNQPQTAAAVTYPTSAIAQRLKTIAQFIGMETPAQIYYAIQPGYDTHNEQPGSHARLLADFSGAVESFLADLKVMGLDDRVLVLAFSEFGRRVNENGSAGTDHGTAGPVFFAGNHVNSGLIGTTPDLSDLDGDDLKMQFDFRSVYATVLQNWLRIPAEESLGQDYATLPIIRGV